MSISCTLKIRGGVDIDSHGKQAGKGALIQWEKSATLGVSQDQFLFVLTDLNPEQLNGLTPISGYGTNKHRLSEQKPGITK